MRVPSPIRIRFVSTRPNRVECFLDDAGPSRTLRGMRRELCQSKIAPATNNVLATNRFSSLAAALLRVSWQHSHPGFLIESTSRALPRILPPPRFDSKVLPNSAPSSFERRRNIRQIVFPRAPNPFRPIQISRHAGFDNSIFGFDNFPPPPRRLDRMLPFTPTQMCHKYVVSLLTPRSRRPSDFNDRSNRRFPPSVSCNRGWERISRLIDLSNDSWAELGAKKHSEGLVKALAKGTMGGLLLSCAGTVAMLVTGGLDTSP